MFAGSRSEAVQLCLSLARDKRGGRIATANLDFLALARRDPQLRKDLQDSSVVVADGMPVVWLGRLSGARSIERLAGADLVAEFFRCGQGRQLKVAIHGSTSEICSRAVKQLHACGAGARIVHVENPPFRQLTHGELEQAISRLRSADPDVVFVALGCPAQERWIAENFQHLPTSLWVGIGGSLDFFAGVRKRAPQFSQRTGTEWLVRMAQEPRRLGKRYLLRDLPAFARIAPGCVSRRSSH